MRDLVLFAQFKTVKSTHGGVLVLVTMRAYFTKSNTSWLFFTFVKLYKWYQIAQRIYLKITRKW